MTSAAGDRLGGAGAGNDGTLELTHDSRTDGRGLDPERSAGKVLAYPQKVAPVDRSYTA